MGVYIKGMEMPKDGVYWCEIGVADDIAMITIHGEDRKSFPLVPVPPHGRLGDLDKLENGLRHMAKYQHGERQQGILGCCETIRLAPTVLEAEEVYGQYTDTAGNFHWCGTHSGEHTIKAEED